MRRKVDVKIADDRSVTLDVKKSAVADFAGAFVEYSIERVRKAAAANKITNVEMLAEGFLVSLNEEVTYFLKHTSPEDQSLLLEWLTTAVVGGYGQDFLARYVKTLAAQDNGGPDNDSQGDGGENGSSGRGGG
ncbi:MAG: hypothetical protein V2A77_08545 [Pseudomonadota bacterium]